MSDPRRPDSARIARHLATLADTPLNFEPASLPEGATGGWNVTDVCQRLPDEPPGPPVAGGSWEIAQRLMSGYEFADPSIVRAYYDPDVPLAQRNMLLKLQAFRFVHLFVGVRVGDVFDEVREVDGQRAQVWGWDYLTLAGHVEMGLMSWEVWKWLDDGRVEFRVHAVSKPASIPNPVVWAGFHLVRGWQRRAFLESTRRRMLKFTELALAGEDVPQRLRDASADLTSQSNNAADPLHDLVSENLRQEQ